MKLRKSQIFIMSFLSIVLVGLLIFTIVLYMAEKKEKKINPKYTAKTELAKNFQQLTSEYDYFAKAIISSEELNKYVKLKGIDLSEQNILLINGIITDEEITIDFFKTSDEMEIKFPDIDAYEVGIFEDNLIQISNNGYIEDLEQIYEIVINKSGVYVATEYLDMDSVNKYEKISDDSFMHEDLEKDVCEIIDVLNKNSECISDKLIYMYKFRQSTISELNDNRIYERLLQNYDIGKSAFILAFPLAEHDGSQFVMEAINEECSAYCSFEEYTGLYKKRIK